jgi:colanic acid biosynthesis glycosyl transferase WcaI
MNILILGLNYKPEPVGIGPYTTGTAEYLVQAGHNVTVVSGKPYYPDWKIQESYRQPGVISTVENGAEVLRVPLYVPAKPTGVRRLIHHASFALRALPVMLGAARKRRPDAVICVAPSLISAVVARGIAKAFGAKMWVHIQDFEVEAAFATGLLRDGGWLTKVARAYEKWCLTATKVSTISPQMCVKLRQLGVQDSSIYEFRNWANIDDIKPLERESVYRAQWNITTPYVALYSGNLGNKQGIEIIVDVARRLTERRDLTFVVCGNGALREQLIAAARGLPNIKFFDLQPAEMLSDLLGLATVHLLPQIAGAADLVLPSKLANMLASGRVVLATANPGTGIAIEVEGCGVVIPPGDAAEMARTLEALLADEAGRQRYGTVGRARAEARWSRHGILQNFEQVLEKTVTGNI